MKLNNIIPIFLISIGVLGLPLPSPSEEKIKVTPLIQTSEGLSGKNFNYLDGKPELRLLRVIIPEGVRTPIHTHPAPMLIYVTRGKIKHVRGEKINFFKAGDAFVESNNGDAHYVQNIGNIPVILHIGVVSVVGLPTTINK